MACLGTDEDGMLYSVEYKNAGQNQTAIMKWISIPANNQEAEALLQNGRSREELNAMYQGRLSKVTGAYGNMIQAGLHPNLLPCRDARAFPKQSGIGWDLYVKMDPGTPITEAAGSLCSDETIIGLGADLCNGLQFCHERNILHGNIRPQNIYTGPNGYRLGSVVSGIGGRQTEGDLLLFASPERCRGMAVDQSGDVYSLGLVLYWLLNDRRLPFVYAGATAEQIYAACSKRINGEPIPAPLRGSPELKAIVQKACAYHPQERYQSAEELKQALLGLMQHQKREVVSSQQQQTGGEEEKGNSKKLWILVLILCLLILLTAVFGWLLLREDEEPSKPKRTSKESSSATTESTTEEDSEPSSETDNEPSSEDSDIQASTSEAPVVVPVINTYELWVTDCDWVQAQQTAREKGGHLVAFESPEEYEHVLQLIQEQGREGVYFRIGARREESGTDYYWVDENDAFYGESLNADSAWCKEQWNGGEPNLVWNEEQEMYVQIFFDPGQQRWVWNDTSNALSYPNWDGGKGYIIEYEGSTP